MIIFLLEWRSYFMERENFNFEESSSDIDKLVKWVNILSAILPISIISGKIAVLYIVKTREGIGDIVELVITLLFAAIIVFSSIKLYNFHDQYSKSSYENLEIPEQIRNNYKDSVVKDVEKKPDYIGSVNLLLNHGFKELIGQMFSTIIAVVGLWIPDSLSKNGNKLYLILSYFILTLCIFYFVSQLLKKVTSRPIEAQDFARVGFCIFTSIISLGALFFFELVFLFKDEWLWIGFILFYFLLIVYVYSASRRSYKHIDIVETLYNQIKDDNDKLS